MSAAGSENYSFSSLSREMGKSLTRLLVAAAWRKEIHLEDHGSSGAHDKRGKV